MAKPPRQVQTPGETQQQPTAADLVDTSPAPETAASTEADALPAAADIDPKTISKAVLTRDGWVCPA